MFQEIPKKKPQTPVLDLINSPRDIQTLSPSELETLANEIRGFLLYTIGKTGGHLGAGLGVVELTISLLKVFNLEKDKIVWDVGHQSYPYKILTGRKDYMHLLRKPNGIAPFPSIEESRYDSFGTGHSSTSISAALGLRLATSKDTEENSIISVIGDGALTAGIAFEALNHAAALKRNLLIIVNDNAMSISKNVGGITNYLPDKPIASGQDNDWSKKSENFSKNFFTEMGFKYKGPIDGHNILELLNALESERSDTGPRILHVKTVKGKGYKPSELDPTRSHAISKIEPKDAKAGKTWSHIFGEWLCSKASTCPEIVGITPAMKEGSGLSEFAEKFPKRFFDVGIAEQHAVTFAAGLAAGGLLPVVAIYSTFLQRAFDQLIHDVAIQNLKVMFVADRAGLVEDGPTHSGVFDISFSRIVPNIIVMVPSSESTLTEMLDLGYSHDGPSIVRYPRGVPENKSKEAKVELGKGALLIEGKKVAILNFGALINEAREAANLENYSLADMRFVKPVDQELIKKLSSTHDLLVTLEENTLLGGAGSAVLEVISSNEIETKTMSIAIPDSFIQQDSPNKMREASGLTRDQILGAIRSKLTEVSNLC